MQVQEIGGNYGEKDIASLMEPQHSNQGKQTASQEL
jgi:hypothetical protein